MKTTYNNLWRITMAYVSVFLLYSWGQAQHPHMTPGMQNEYEKFLALINTNEVTHVATGGNWSSASSWVGGVPTANAKVHIPAGVTITVDGEFSARIKWIRVDGRLRFTTNQNTRLLVETIGVTPNGELEIGKASQPVAGNVTARITFIDNGNIDINYDPLLMSRGLVSYGKVVMFGQWKTPFLKTNHWVPAGSNTITLESTPVNWKVGDQIVMSGIKDKESETFTISAISGNQITLSAPTVKTRAIVSNDPVFAGLFPYVAHYTRNIVLESENVTQHHRRAHIMFLHNNNLDLQNVLFRELGRTFKGQEFFVGNANASDNNMIGRYSLHIHRAGDKDKNGAFGYVKGCALWGSPGWGYVNHQSHVWFDDNTSYNVFGSHFTDEDGTELGGFRRNIAIHSTGSESGTYAEKNRKPGDHGHTGIGFWATAGASVRWEGNVATDQNTAGFAIISRKMPSDAQNYDPNNFDDPAIGAGLKELLPAVTGMNFFRNNVNYGGYHGLGIIDMELNGLINSNNVFENFTVFNTRASRSLDIEYARNVTIKNSRIVRDHQLMGVTDQWNGRYAIKANSTFDHLFTFQTKSWTIVEGTTIAGFLRAFENTRNSDGANASDDGKFYLVGNRNLIKLHGGGQLSQIMTPDYFREIPNPEDVPARPVFSVAPGVHTGSVSLTISSEPGAQIYYSTIALNSEREMQDFPDLSKSAAAAKNLSFTPERLYNGQAINFTTPYNVIFAIAVKNGIQSRVMSGWYYTNQASAINVTGVSITTATPVNLAQGNTINLQYNVLPHNASNKNVTWTSSNSSIATVNSAGQVTAIAPGSATITVTTQQGNHTAAITVNVPAPSLSVNASQVNFAHGAQNQNISVTSNQNWTIIKTSEWLTVSPANGSNNGNFTISASENTVTSERSSVVSVTGGGITRTINVNQAAAPLRYTLNISNMNGTVIRNPNQADYAANTVVTITATPNPGYVFANWSGDASGSSAVAVITMNSNKNVTANFNTVPTPPVGSGYRFLRLEIVACNAAEIVELRWVEAGVQYPVNRPVAASLVTGVANANKAFDNLFDWGPNFGSSPGNLVLDNTTAINPSQIILHLPTWGSISHFRTYGGSSATGPWTLLGDFSGLTNANFPNRVGTFNLSGGTPPPVVYSLNTSAVNGSVTVSPAKSAYNVGEQVTLTAVPNSGYMFSHWSGHATGNNATTTITMDGNKNVTANFEVIPITYRYLKLVMTSGSSNAEIADIMWMSGGLNYPRTRLDWNNRHKAFGSNGAHGAYDSDLQWGVTLGANGEAGIDLESTPINPNQIVIRKPSHGTIGGFIAQGSNSLSGSWTTLLVRSGLTSADFPGNIGTFNIGSGAREEFLFYSYARDPEIKVYPNPSNGIFNINATNEYDVVDILNSNGTKVYTTPINGQVTIQLTGLPSGLYEIMVHGNNKVSTHRIIIE